MDILTFGTLNLLKHWGSITSEQVVQARNARNQQCANATSLADVRPKTNAEMMFHFLCDSSGPIPRKKIATKLEDIQEDGPTLLKTVMSNTFVRTKASTFAIKEKFYDLHLKKFKWNVEIMNQHI